MTEYKIYQDIADKISKGKKLLKEADFIKNQGVETLEEGKVITLVNEKRHFIGKMLVGRQNKGLGWIIITKREVEWNADFVDHLINLALQNRQTFFNNEDTTAFRIFNGEGDGIGGISLDYYDGYIQADLYSSGIYLYRDWFYQSLKKHFGSLKGIYQTVRFKDSKLENAVSLVEGAPAPQPLIVLENQIKYAVYLGQEWMTGIFLDQREVRDFVRSQAQGRKVLNLFSYTAAFSVAASLGQAEATVSVDVANRSLEKSQEQFSLNHLESGNEINKILVMDVFDYFKYAKRKHLKFDFIICDPPSFARTKHRVFKVDKDYLILAKDIFDLTNVNGMIILSTNHSGYSMDKFKEDILLASQKSEGQYHLIQQFQLPEDFPVSQDMESQYLKVLVFYRSE